MSPEHDKALCDAYPYVFKLRNRRPETWPISWGFELEDGWYDIIDVLCRALYSSYSTAENRYRTLKDREGQRQVGGKVVTAADVDEAERLMLAARKRVPVCRQAKQKFGTLRFHVNRATDVESAYVDFAERMSARTCEVCGARGKLRTGGWVRTLCDAHEAERDRGQAGSMSPVERDRAG
jgi:hypothetical protein